MRSDKGQGSSAWASRRPDVAWRVLAAVLALAAVFAGVSLPAQKAYGVEAGSISGVYSGDGRPLANVAINVYRVASWDAADGSWKPAAPFDRYAVSWDIADADQEHLRELAGTLSSYAARDRVTATKTTISGGDGGFAVPGLADGLYLLASARWTGGDLTCGTSDALVALPATDGNRAISVKPKTECGTQPQQTVPLAVHKEWKGSASLMGGHPSSIDMQLLRDGVVHDTVSLSAANGWSHEWEGLDAGHEWQVVERVVPQGYTVLASRDGTVVTVTNTALPPLPPTGSNIMLIGGIVLALAVLGLMMLAFRQRRRDGDGTGDDATHDGRVDGSDDPGNPADIANGGPEEASAAGPRTEPGPVRES